jgi:SAM-dependent methyltransferase
VQNWYNIWFDSPYYHLLYKHRDDEEARMFLSSLVKKLDLNAGCKILDLACGKGRHSIYLHQQGFDVTGADLSPSNISAANEYAAEGLRFFEHDMRNPLPNSEFDVVLNLFTSFGYFDNHEENYKVLRAVHDELKQNGLFVIDFMNCNEVINNLISNEIKIIEDTTFQITRELNNGIVKKTITINHNPNLVFEEKVQALYEDDFKLMLVDCGFDIMNTYGSYLFEPFENEKSERLILIAQKK